MFVLGLATSLHCVGMCGGLVLTYAVEGTQDGPWLRRLLPHLAYQGSKILSYTLIALGLALLAAVASLAVNGDTTKPVLNWVQLAAGVYMVLLGVGMTGKVQVLRHLTPRPPQFLMRALSRRRKKAVSDAREGHASLATPIAFGLLTGLMPCTPLINAQVQAVAQGSVLSSMFGMAAFGLGTMPLTLAFGLTSDLVSAKLRKSFNIVAAIAVILFGLVFLNRGLVAVGSPITFDSVRTAIVGTSGASTTDGLQFAKGADGVVEVPLAIVDTAYVPETVQVPADVPVRLVVDRQEDAACSDRLVIQGAGVDAALTPNGVTKVDLPPLKAGTYHMTCQMNMMSGTLLVGGAVAGAGPILPLAIGLVVLIGVALAVYRWRSRKRSAAAAATKQGKNSKKGSGSGKGASATAPAKSEGPLFLGFQPTEIALGAGILLIAIVAGRWFGGFFH
jgi:sulfite exporter TauE/SafE